MILAGGTKSFGDPDWGNVYVIKTDTAGELIWQKSIGQNNFYERAYGIDTTANGGIVLALMSVPVIVSVGEDALKAVPDSYREAAIALGASRWEIVYRVLFPAAKNGLLAAVLLGVGRAIGETMAVLMATGHSNQIPTSVLDRVQTLTATIAAELGETVQGDDHYRVLFVIGILLFVIAFAVNLTADLVVKGIRGKQNG